MSSNQTWYAQLSPLRVPSDAEAQAKLNLHRDDVSPEAQRLVLPDGHDAAPLKGKALLPADQVRVGCCMGAAGWAW